MQSDFEIKTPSLAASTELLVMAPIRRGFVPSLDTITYKSRAKLLLKMLHGGRQSQHEYRPLRAMSDAVERVGVIRSLRVAVVEGRSDIDDRILLSVHFDGSYEAYVRTIWQRAARLLDLIFCNADGYVTGWDRPFDDWNAWIRSVQVSTPFFYATPGLTYPDQTYLQMLERRDRGGTDDELRRTQIAVPTAEEIAWSIVVRKMDPTKRADKEPATGPMAGTEVFRQNLSALAGIYKLAEWYLPGTPDGSVLRNAAHEVLPQLRDMFLSDPNGLGASAGGVGGDRLAKALAWFIEGLESVPPTRAGTPLPKKAPSPDPEGDVQGGILEPYVGVTDAVMLLVAFDGAQGAATLLGGLGATSETYSATPTNKVFVNLALTHDGLRVCGLTQAELEQWPLEFRQGMSARAGLLGDLRWNHPRRWTLPRYNGALVPDPYRDDSALPPVPLESVHAIIQLRLRPAEGSERRTVRDVLADAVREFYPEFAGIRLLSVQWLERQIEAKTFVDHFGYTDGHSQPDLGRNPDQTSLYSNQVHLGEVLVGYTNAADREQDQVINQDPQTRALMRNGSFLAVRKLRQRAAAFRAAVAAAQKHTGIDEKIIRAHMMGRWPADAGQDAGKPLAPLGEGGINDFSYREEDEDNITPLTAHIRRANPREVTEPNDYPKPAPGGRTPRIVRRSLPYGPPVDLEKPDNADRGLMFMAYGASLAEQFEVIQGWLAGGNSARSYSGAGCPFLGVPEAGRERDFRFLSVNQKTVHMSLDGSDDLGTEPEPLVTLQWGLYAFAPSHSAQALLAKRASGAVAATALPWSTSRGQVLIDQLRRVEDNEGAAAGTVAWKAALEDPDSAARFDSASIWAAVRALRGGVLRIPYGILVAAPDLVDAVLKDETRYTVDGYRRRLVAAGMGPIYLGRDASDPEYARLSTACNVEIQSIPSEEGYRIARKAAGDLLGGWIKHTIAIAEQNGEKTWELSLDSRDLIAGTLATLGEAWFGLDDRTKAKNADGIERALFQRGAMDWQWRPGDPVYYPGHFTAASRATFQAEPSNQVAELAAEHGTALSAALRSLIEKKGVAAFDHARVSKAVLKSFWSTEPDVAVQNIAGALMGLLPTTEGILRRVLPEWTRAGTLLELAGRASGRDLEDWTVAEELLSGPLREAIKFRPVPEQVWREAKVAHRVGGATGEPVKPGEKLIIGQVSTLHAQLEHGDTTDVFAAFGGKRGEGQPTHACPGYDAAVGAMMGLMSATLVRDEGQLATSTSPGVLVFRGRAPNPEEIVIWTPPPVGVRKSLPGEGKRLLAFGDSWIRFLEEDRPTGGDFWRALGALGYDTHDFDNTNYAYRGRKLEEMAGYDPKESKYVYARLRKLINAGTPPSAVLVSGGGNDFVDGTYPLPMLDCATYAGLNSKLEGILRKQNESPQYDKKLLNAFLGEMKRHLTTIVSNLAEAGKGPDGKQLVPIVVVAYDYPIPDGRPWKSTLKCPWVRPVFSRKSYDAPNDKGEGESSTLMATFIARLNQAYGEVAVDLTKQGVRVRHVPLTGLLSKYQNDKQLAYDKVWKNELHPTKVGFEVLADYLHEVALKPLFAQNPKTRKRRHS